MSQSIASTSALIMAGGRSERMRSNGCVLHKGLRTVCGRSLAEWNLTTLLYYGFSELYIAVSRTEVALHEWITEYGQLQAESAGARLTVLVEEAPLGTIGAARLIPAHISTLLVVNVDNLTRLNLVELTSYHLDTKAAATVASHEEPFRIPFGRLVITGEAVTAYEEKPEIFVTVSSGTYVLSRRAMDLIVPDRATDIPELIDLLLASGMPVNAYRHTAHWIDVNHEAALALAELMIQREQEWPGSPRMEKSRG